MTAEAELCFLDTNVWLYALARSSPPQEARKQQAAASLLSQPQRIALSVQIVSKICRNVLRRGHVGEQQIRELIETLFKRCEIVELSHDVLLQASNLRERYSLSFWDSLIVSAALASNSSILYSEDMQDGLVVADTLRIVNPFK